MLRLASSAGLLLALAAGPAQAQNVFITTLRGANENPPVASAGTGVALVIFDESFSNMAVRTTFSGLTTPTVDGHIHCCAPTTANAPVAVGFRPAGFPLGVTAGEFNATFDLNLPATFNPPFLAANGGTAASARTALINGTQGGLAYVNIHTSRFPGGEIRGQLVTSPQLTPQAYGLLPEAALQTNEFQDSTIRRYLRDFRGTGSGLEGQTATLDDGRIGMFLIAGARTGGFDGRDDRPPVDLGAVGLVGGVDYRLGPSSLIGVMLGYETSDARLSPGSRQSNINSWYGGAYGTFARGPVWLDLYGSYTSSDYDLRRGISVLPFVAESLAETSSEQWMLGGTAGITFGTSRFEIEPYVGARYVDLDMDGFTETGNIAALTIGDMQVESLQSIVGLSLGADVPLGGGASLRPSLRGEWRHEFENDEPRLIAGSFGGFGPFTFATSPLSDDHFVVGAGFSIAGDGPVSLLVDYTGQFDGGYDIHALSGGVRVTF